MKPIYVIYFSGSGNTEAMAHAVGEGITQAGGEASIVEVSSMSVEDLKDAAAFALGCPACGSEELDESMDTFITSIEGDLEGKLIGLFGSYGWGDGEWMREWENRMESAGAKIAGEEGVIVNGEPDDETRESCKKLGKELV